MAFKWVLLSAAMFGAALPAPAGAVTLHVGELKTLAARCAPTVAPETLLAVARTESANNPFAIGVNKGARLSRQPASKAEAVRVARSLLQSGANFDLGLGQINSKNLAWLGLSVEDAFDPCRNMAASAKVLELGYRAGARRTSSPQEALRIALSMYNTGDASRGFRNGYVAKVVRSAGHVVPALAVTPAAPVRQLAATPASAAPEPLAPAGMDPVQGLDPATSEKVALAASAVEAATPQQSPEPEKEAAPAWDIFARRGQSQHVFSN